MTLRWEKTAFFLHLLLALAGFAGGLNAVLNPEGPPGITTDILAGSLFENFLIPGLFLIIVIGLGNLLAAFMVWRGWQIAPYLTAFLGVLMILWIVIQAAIISWNSLHVVFLIVGIIQLLIGLKNIARDGNFPF